MTVGWFTEARKGNVAVIFALLVLPVVACIGAALDYSKVSRVQSMAQEALDGAMLAASVSDHETEIDLETDIKAYLKANLPERELEERRLFAVSYDRLDDRIGAKLSGRVNTIFLGLFGIESVEIQVASVSLRGVRASLEVALVLDNTWSMSELDNSGVRKIDALKAAAKTLVDKITADPKADVRIAIVPYADYVNVGTANRAMPWLSVPPDVVAATPKVCTKSTTRTTCTRKTCTRTVDGVTESYACNDQCTTITVPEYETCTGPSTSTSTWWGCVKSRNAGTLRLDDSQPQTPYTGLITKTQTCLNPILPLTTSKSTVTRAIDNLIINIGTGYRPDTYIPAGLVWGVNVLSPTAPFTEASAYDPENRRPQKVLVLMTDGENTRRYQSSDGTHPGFSSTASTALTQKRDTNRDTLALCTYAKSKKIDVYTVSLGVKDAEVQVMLDTCASSEQMYFQATNGSQMANAFSKIARGLKEVRIEK